MNLINTKDMEALSKLPPSEFEIERKRIINKYINSLPADCQAQARAMQADLDIKRLSLSSEDFLTYCMSRVRTNLNTIADLADQAAIIATEIENSLING